MSDYKPVRDASKRLYKFYAVITIEYTRLFIYQFEQLKKKMKSFFLQKIVDEQIETFDENHERHFIDMYIKEIRQAEANPNQNSSFSCNIHDIILKLPDKPINIFILKSSFFR